MKKNCVTISLTQILFNVVESSAKLTPKSLARMPYDTRHDFMLDQTSPVLAVKMVFTNEQNLLSEARKGVRRSVTVSLLDKKTRTCLGSCSKTICMKLYETFRSFTASIPFDADKLDYGHEHKVEVRDDKTGFVLGSGDIRFFRSEYLGWPADESFSPYSGGVLPENGEQIVRAFDAELNVYHNVWFGLKKASWFHMLPFVPEVEVRITFNDGSVFSRMVVPKAMGCDKCELEAPFFLALEKTGICYAEVILFDHAVAGFVFNTDYHETMVGTWCTPETLLPMDEYSLKEAHRRFWFDDDVIAKSQYMIDDVDDELEEHDDVYDCDAEADSPEEDPFEKAINDFISSSLDEDTQEQPQKDDTPMAANEEDKSLGDSLDHLTGLKSVKEKLLAYEKLMLFNKMRRDSGLCTLKLPLHAMFWGSPGTGKTTVAEKMGQMLKRMGVLSRGHVVKKERSKLMGPNYSSEEKATLDAIEEARGGILLIDEAYQLYQPNDPRDPGRFVIETLMTALSDEHNRDWMLILAGYTDEMKRMFEMNPGLKSRIPDSNIYIFDDFTDTELMEIAENYLIDHNFALTPGARDALASRLGYDYNHRDRSFGNGRHVINLIETEIIPTMAARVVTSETPVDLTLIQPADIPRPLNLVSEKRTKMGFCA